MTAKTAIVIAILLSGFTAILMGLRGLFADPLISVLLVFGGMILAICSAVELVFGDSSEDRNSTRPQGGAFNLPA